MGHKTSFRPSLGCGLELSIINTTKIKSARGRNILTNFKQWICIMRYHNSNLETVLAGKFSMTSVLFCLNHLQVAFAGGE